MTKVVTMPRVDRANDGDERVYNSRNDIDGVVRHVKSMM